MEYKLNLSNDTKEEVDERIFESYDEHAIPPDPEIVKTYEVP